MNAQDALLQRFESGEFSGKTLNELLKLLSVPFRERGRLASTLDALVLKGALYETHDGRYGTKEGLGLIEGTVTGNERGFAFLTPTDTEQYPNDFFLPPRHLNGALHKDTVLIEPLPYRSEDEAIVVAILKRGYEEIVGTFYKDKRAGYLYPDEKRFSQTVFIPLQSCRAIANGVKAVAKITDYPRGKAPGGVIVEVLGDETDFYAEELSIIRAHKLKERFSDGLNAEAERALKRGIKAEDLVGRSDFRGERIFTIDGDDTRDIDDALSIRKTENGYLLGVHIADVSHYVKYRSPLDEEAYERGTSVYFPDRVLPMLPKALSNGICSLNEGEDRLALSCVMLIDEKGVTKSFELTKSVIRSVKKTTYQKVQAVLDGDENAKKEYREIAEEIALCAELATILKAARDKKGGVALDVKEVKISVDERGNIVVPDAKRPFSAEIIEQFMVKANETVAEYAYSLSLPFIYRVHEKPTAEKAESFRAFALGLGLKAKWNADDVKPYDFSNLLKSAETLPSFPVLNRVMLRSMQKARYAPVNAGHFGLASDCYCHFTSPIRRYPDLCIHRILKEVIDGKYEEAIALYSSFVSLASTASSERERIAADAEREVDALYIASYMSERIGQEYSAVVSGVTSFGVFAEIEGGIEGLIPLETLAGEFEYIPERFLLKGTKNSFCIGQPLRVRVEDVDFYERRTRFSLLEE